MNSSLSLFIYSNPCLCFHSKIDSDLPHTLQLLYPERPGEKNGPNIIPRDWVRELMDGKVSDGTIIETNSYYEGDRDTTEKHRETLRVNGWTFAPVDIMDENGAVFLPIEGGKWFTEMSVGKTLPEYDSLLALTHLTPFHPSAP